VHGRTFLRPLICLLLSAACGAAGRDAAMEGAGDARLGGDVPLSSAQDAGRAESRDARSDAHGGQEGPGARDARPLDRAADGGSPAPGCTAGARQPPGSACACDPACESGHCVDGVCCMSACLGPCRSCDQPGHRGVCLAADPGSPDPHGLCKKEAPEACGLSGLCADAGVCARAPVGSSCGPAACVSGALVHPVCQPDRSCRAGEPVSCAPSTCANGGCTLACASDRECTAPRACVNGSCGPRGIGQACGAATECASGFCADGVCCESGCDGVCVSCAQPSAPGRCLPVPAGMADTSTNPAQVCGDEGAASCGLDGRCDGVGGCQRYAAGVPCRPEVCDASTNSWTPAGACAATGCSAPGPRSCAPFRCDAQGVRCSTLCASNADCAAPAVCRDGSCGVRPGGSPCAKAADCGSGFCAQGVCCNSACGESCYACNLPDRLGVCTALPDGGRDPAGVCTDDGESTCGNDGTCNGSGGCRKYGPDTVCAAGACKSGVKTAASYCSGTGKCLAGSAVACDPYVCNGSGTDCFGACHGVGPASECLAPNLCNDQRCGDARKGQTCGATADCAPGLTCVDRVCCESSCSGPCKTCKRVPGTCTDLPQGSSSSGCKGDGKNVCGRTGKCDSSGGCALGATSTTGAPGACSGPSAGTKPATCDGRGACGQAAALDCGDNRCGSGTCLPCAKDADCLGGRACDVASATCGSQAANGVACSTGLACASGACVDGHCCARPACGPCESCGSGTCAPVVSAPDPDSCPDQRPANLCGRTGCDGVGACTAFPPASTVVAGPTCKDAATTTISTCDGSGHTLINDTPCLSGETCRDGVCKRLALGSACTAGNQCGSGQCADGVCCDDRCDGACQACSAMGACTMVTGAPDTDTCPDETASKPCGRTGCDGAGSCGFAAAGTTCGDPTCDGAVLARPRCSGDGACAPALTDCAARGQSCAAEGCVSVPSDGAAPADAAPADAAPADAAPADAASDGG
jgi:hypothetical protein